MKVLHVFLFLFFVCSITFAQLHETAAQFGLTAKIGYNYETRGTHSQFGMELLAPVSKKINLHYSFSMGTNERQKFAAYTTFGMYIGGWVGEKVFANTANTSDIYNLFFLIAILVPEGVSMRIPLNQNKMIFLVPYLKPLGIDYNLYNDFRWNYCASAGTRIGIFASKNVIITPEICAKYTVRHPSGTGGITNIFAGIGLWVQTSPKE